MKLVFVLFLLTASAALADEWDDDEWQEDAMPQDAIANFLAADYGDETEIIAWINHKLDGVVGVDPVKPGQGFANSFDDGRVRAPLRFVLLTPATILQGVGRPGQYTCAKRCAPQKVARLENHQQKAEGLDHRVHWDCTGGFQRRMYAKVGRQESQHQGYERSQCQWKG